MTKNEHEKIVRILQAKNQERHDKIVKELLAKREPMRISFDWKFSNVFWRFVIVSIFAIVSIVGNIWQFTIYRENTQTIRKLENYSIIVRFTNARGFIYSNELHRVLQDLQCPTGDTTRLLQDVHRIIREFESGKSLIRQVENQN